eukprot:g1972.t1
MYSSLNDSDAEGMNPVPTNRDRAYVSSNLDSKSQRELVDSVSIHPEPNPRSNSFNRGIIESYGDGNDISPGLPVSSNAIMFPQERNVMSFSNNPSLYQPPNPEYSHGEPEPSNDTRSFQEQSLLSYNNFIYQKASTVQPVFDKDIDGLKFINSDIMNHSLSRLHQQGKEELKVNAQTNDNGAVNERSHNSVEDRMFYNEFIQLPQRLALKADNSTVYHFGDSYLQDDVWNNPRERRRDQYKGKEVDINSEYVFHGKDMCETDKDVNNKEIGVYGKKREAHFQTPESEELKPWYNDAMQRKDECEEREISKQGTNTTADLEETRSIRQVRKRVCPFVVEDTIHVASKPTPKRRRFNSKMTAKKSKLQSPASMIVQPSETKEKNVKGNVVPTPKNEESIDHSAETSALNSSFSHHATPFMIEQSDEDSEMKGESQSCEESKHVESKITGLITNAAEGLVKIVHELEEPIDIVKTKDLRNELRDELRNVEDLIENAESDDVRKTIMNSNLVSILQTVQYRIEQLDFPVDVTNKDVETMKRDVEATNKDVETTEEHFEVRTQEEEDLEEERHFNINGISGYGPITSFDLSYVYKYQSRTTSLPMLLLTSYLDHHHPESMHKRDLVYDGIGTYYNGVARKKGHLPFSMLELYPPTSTTLSATMTTKAHNESSEPMGSTMNPKSTEVHQYSTMKDISSSSSNNPSPSDSPKMSLSDTSFYYLSSSLEESDKEQELDNRNENVPMSLSPDYKYDTKRSLDTKNPKPCSSGEKVSSRSNDKNGTNLMEVSEEPKRYFCDNVIFENIAKRAGLYHTDDKSWEKQLAMNHISSLVLKLFQCWNEYQTTKEKRKLSSHTRSRSSSRRPSTRHTSNSTRHTSNRTSSRSRSRNHSTSNRNRSSSHMRDNQPQQVDEYTEKYMSKYILPLLKMIEDASVKEGIREREEDWHISPSVYQHEQCYDEPSFDDPCYQEDFHQCNPKKENYSLHNNSGRIERLHDSFLFGDETSAADMLLFAFLLVIERQGHIDLKSFIFHRIRQLISQDSTTHRNEEQEPLLRKLKIEKMYDSMLRDAAFQEAILRFTKSLEVRGRLRQPLQQLGAADQKNTYRYKNNRKRHQHNEWESLQRNDSNSTD